MPIPTTPADSRRQTDSTVAPLKPKSSRIVSPGEISPPRQTDKQRDLFCSQEQRKGDRLQLVTPPADHRFMRGRY
jgi:hypothetical protein